MKRHRIHCNLGQVEPHFQNCFYGSEDSRLRAIDLAKDRDMFSDTLTLEKMTVKSPDEDTDMTDINGLI